MGASPIVAHGKVFMTCDHDQDAFLLTLDKRRWQDVWKVERPDMVHSFSTPAIYEPSSGPAEIFVPGSYQLTSYDVSTGSLLWRVG
jgi:outer membrane protein assembly factor BamB